MFGLTHKISDPSVYLLHDMLENMFENAAKEFENTPQDKVEEKAELLVQLAYWKQELTTFEKEIEEQRKQSFQFSIEQLYYMYGQYDKFVGVEFHKFSEAAKKFGRNIGGVIVYGKNERKDLEAIINSDNVPKTNGIVRIDVSSNYDLTEEQSKELLQTGFMSGDIYEILTTNTPLSNAYIQKGKKEIPNTINVTIPKGMHPVKLALYNLNLQLENGQTLIEADWNKYFGYNLYYHPELKREAKLKDKLYEQNGNLKNEVRFHELSAKHLSSDITPDEKKEFSNLLKDRRLKRFEILKVELRKTNINSIEEFKATHPNIYDEVYKTALVFEDEVLNFKPSGIPIYWDFKSYLHIYLRHCEELQPVGHFKSKTPFSYHQKDIRRILKIAIDKLEEKIQERLTKGLEFRTYGEKALYFNGNYYSMRIESSGRVDSFHPHEANQNGS